MAMVGCASLEPRENRAGDISYLYEHRPAKPSVSITNVDEARSVLDGLRQLMVDGASGRSQYQDVLNEFVFYGALTAVIGIATDGIAARNIGAGVAGISGAASNHYQLDKQTGVFLKAYARAGCVLDALNGVTLANYALFDGMPLGKAGGLDLDDEYSKIPDKTIGAVGSIATLLKADLSQITLGTPSFDDMRKSAMAIDEAAKAAKDVQPTKPGKDSEAAATLAANEVVIVRHQLASVPINTNQATTGAMTAFGTTNGEARAKLQGLLAEKERESAAASRAAAVQSAAKTEFLKSVAQFDARTDVCIKGP